MEQHTDRDFYCTLRSRDKGANHDTTYTKYTMTNEGLTDRIQEIIRKGVTASAGGSVRIPASGTDSRIRLHRSIVTPICDQKIVNGGGTYPTNA